MENNISFIPKKPLAKNEFSRRRPLFSYSFFVALTIALLAMTFAIVNFIKLESAKRELVLEKQKLVEYSAQNFGENFNKRTTEIKDFSKEIDIAKILLKRHVAVSNLLQYIGDITPSNITGKQPLKKIVSFNNFSYSNAAGGPQISMTGEAATYTVLSAFSKALKEKSSENTRFIKSYQISNIVLSEAKNNVQFSFSATFDPELVSYAHQDILEAVETKAPLVDLTKPISQ
jgi:hypothetical protein